MDIISLILWWIIYLLVWYKMGLLFAVIIGVLTMVYGVLNYYKGGDYVDKLHDTFYSE